MESSESRGTTPLPLARRLDRLMKAADKARWRDLEANAHLPEVQEIIRRDIQHGVIRVRPKPGGGICIVPIATRDDEEIGTVEPTLLQEETYQAGRPVRIRRSAARR
jgi:hypothetical protein